MSGRSRPAPPTTATMKLLIDTGAQRVLFAEAGKDVVDFIFSLLALPFGAIVKLLADVDTLGSVGNVRASVENMDDAYMECLSPRSTLLPNPRLPARSPPTAVASDLYYSPAPPPPSGLLSPPLYPSLSLPKDGFVVSVSMYTVTDDLTVAPASGMLLHNLGIKDLTGLEERTVDVSHEQGLEILKAALHSKTVLTDVFLAQKKKARTDVDANSK